MAGETILIIEDEQPVRQVYAKALRNAGYEVIEAEDGQSGLGHALFQQPAIILLDLDIPNFNGLEIADVLRGNPSMARTPIIAVTGHTTDADRAHALHAGFNAFIAKPVDLQELLAVVRKYLLTR